MADAKGDRSARARKGGRKGKRTVEDQVDRLLEGEARRLDQAAGRGGPRKAKGRRRKP